MKLRGKNSGRRGKRLRKQEARLVFLEEVKMKAEAEEKARCEEYLARIMPRMLRLCPLSEIGEITVTLKTSYAQVFYTVDGIKNHSGYYHCYTWDSFSSAALEDVAKIKHFEIVRPKNPMLILAEIAAGLHETL